MKLKYIFPVICFAAILFVRCKGDEGRKVFPYSCPEISNVTYSITDQIEASNTLTFSLDIKDPKTPLSTLEVNLTIGEKEFNYKSMRTPGYNAEIRDYEVFIPFYAELEECEATLTITSINVEGSEKKEIKTFTVKRPQLPDKIYLHYEDKVIPMIKDETSPYLYATEKGDYPVKFTGKISTDESLIDSRFIWAYADKVNQADLGSVPSPDFIFDYTNWEIDKITFNVFAFNLGVDGILRELKLKDISLQLTDNYYYAPINFEQGEELEAYGFDNLEGAYNRDFFEYNSVTNKLTFLRDTGIWEVYYYPKYNYIWIMRMDDVAPAAFWLVGHGFTCAPVWNTDYDSGGWELDIFYRLGYVVKISENKYQTTVYLNDTHIWDSFEIEIYSDREWSKDKGIELQPGSLSGDIDGITISNSKGITNSGGFVKGYYRLTFDTSAGVSNETMNIERIGD